jgi:acid phosphatase (class A)
METKMIKNLFLSVLFFVGCSTAPHAVNETPAAAPSASVSPATPAVVPDFIQTLKGPPARGTKADRVDYHTLLKLQNTRTAAECARAKTEVKISLASFYGAPYGPLSPSEVKQWSDFLYTVGMEADVYVHMAKKNFQRPRPYLTHPDLHPCVKRETTFSYPSGHAALSRFYMHVIEDIYPQMKADLEKRADQIALDRNIGGVHYPSDIKDGKLLGDRIYDYQVKNTNLKERTHAKMSELGGVSQDITQ